MLIEVLVEDPVQPDGKVQVYEVAPLTEDMLNVFELPEQIVVLPVIAPGCVGADVVTVTDRVWALLEPQELFAMTCMFPDVAPGITTIELVVEVPVQPEGNVQV